MGIVDQKPFGSLSHLRWSIRPDPYFNQIRHQNQIFGQDGETITQVQVSQRHSSCVR